MLIGVALLVGIVFGLFAVVTVPIEMSKMIQAEHWRSRKAVITHSYTRHVRGSATRPRANSSWVYYSPDNPKETILEPHAPWDKMIILLSAGIGFLLLPFFLWVFRKKIEPEHYGRA